MRTVRILCTLALFFVLQPAPAQGQQMDREVMKRWGSVKVVSYHVVGVYKAQTDVIGGGNWIGYADVTDRVTIDLKWKLSEAKLVGAPTILNGRSTSNNLRNFQPGCLPPALKGEYEHYDLLAIKEGPSGALELQVRTTYPAAEVVQSCSGSRTSVPASVDTRPEEMVLPSPLLLAMPLPDSDDLRIGSDKKSFVVKKNGWTWTFTPSGDASK